MSNACRARAQPRGLETSRSVSAYEMFNPQSRSYDAQLTARTHAVRVHNLKLLLKHRARIVCSDRYGNTPVDDVLYLQKLDVFTNLQPLKAWCEATSEMIFPQAQNRPLQGRIGVAH